MATSIRNPVVVILGATGTGKTKLSLELAKIFNGEIISADAMQLYKGLDIITNKASPEERLACKHHLIDFLSPLKQNNNVVDYRDQAVPIIASLLEQKKTPVIAGGTFYFVEALLWKHLVNEEDVKRAASSQPPTQTKFPKLQGVKKIRGEVEHTDAGKDVDIGGNTSEQPDIVCDSDERSRVLPTDDDNNEEIDRAAENIDENSEEIHDKYENMSTEELYKRFWEVDPESAKKFHPNDRRKIRRAVQIYDQHGIPMSQIYKAQRHGISESALSGPPRYKDCCVFWLQCKPDVLEKRLDDRVDKMLELGLLDELAGFHKQYNKDRLQEGKEADYTRGIFQSIGFKEFHNYLILSDEERESEKGKKALQHGIEEMKKVTRKYARYQNKWMRTRFIKRPGREAAIPVYGLDCTDVSLWDQNVSTPATTILTALRKGEESPIPPIPFEEEMKHEYVYRECKYCNVITVIEEMWEKHIKTRKHRNKKSHYKKQMAALSQNLDTYVQQKKSAEEEVTT